MFANKQGFTLIELMAVVLIIGILTAIAVPQYTKSIRRAEMMEGLTNGKTLLDSAVRFRSINSEVPTNFNQIDASFIGVDSFAGTEIDDGNFTYTLMSDRVRVTSNKGDYHLDFMYPTHNANGVYAPIACCPDTSWVCQSTAQASTTPTLPSGCREIK
ncbi:MAG: prepilin-type N-terminal cleavage/methylation domain-containing protein [Elusimicrobiaceae bacterium]|nr:prepilin-type N-terminal cleavage/methylation domain-containing protein [Elusimicrobiaceae bacterium]